MKKLGVFAGVISILCLGILGCNEESSNPIRVQAEIQESSSSAQKAKSSDDEESSSSEKNSEIEGKSSHDGKSSSSVKAPEKQAESSSSSLDKSEKSSSSNDKVESSSSSKKQNSSSSKALSSSSEAPVETRSWYNQTSYQTARVVAANASELECDDETDEDALVGYEVAYEFNAPNDLGHDYFGEHNAFIDYQVPSISAECGSAIFDGSNGLLIPLDEIFKSRGFVAEVRFMPTASSEMGNIFVAEPPGSGKNGWQIRIDGTTITFHMRDTSVHSTWESLPLGKVALNEWHVVRVKIFPRKDDITGEVKYMLNALLDGKPRITTAFRADMSNIEYGLGIGYDSMYQTLHKDRFFTGKIDYIRYGRITEDNL